MTCCSTESQSWNLQRVVEEWRLESSFKNSGHLRISLSTVTSDGVNKHYVYSLFHLLLKSCLPSIGKYHSFTIRNQILSQTPCGAL